MTSFLSFLLLYPLASFLLLSPFSDSSTFCTGYAFNSNPKSWTLSSGDYLPIENLTGRNWIQASVALREAELQKEVEIMNALTRMEKLKAEFLSKPSVEYETKVQDTNWELYRKQKVVEASLYEKEKEAATQINQQVADGELFAKQKEAEGLVAVAQYQGTYIRTLLGTFGGNYKAFRDYLMINGGMFQEIAKINGEAVKSLQPKISIWTGAGGSDGDGGDGGAMKEVAGLYKMLPPLFNTVHEQTVMSGCCRQIGWGRSLLN
ncbi:hypothetical protein L1887_01020 [Cichorium endivia]|nr:hypothetical protein L1887_01020 [Cichorium endivia]